MTKRRAEIADDVAKFVAVGFEDLIVRIFQVPVVDQGHHDLQALKLLCADKWILLPLPLARSFQTFRTCFKPDV